MFPRFGSTAETLSKASSVMFRIGTDAHLYDDPDDVSIAPLLDSRFDSEICEALKRLLALIAQGIDVSNFFPQVVMNVASQSVEVKKLVYLYLLHYSENCTFTDHVVELNSEKNDSSMRDNLLILCQSLASKMLSNANLYLVSVDMPVAANFDDASGLCLRFSGDILSNLIPCLITITIEGKCSTPLNIAVKVNCEETIFGLNLLNRVVAFLG